MKAGSRVLVISLVALLFAGCTPDLRNIPKPLYLSTAAMSDSLKVFRTFSFRPRDSKGSVIIEGQMHRYLQSMLEAKGYELSEDDPDFFVTVDYDSYTRKSYLYLPGIYRASHDHSPYSYFSTDTEDITDEYYVHGFDIKLWMLGWDDPMWWYSTESYCEIQDFRMSAPSLLKNFILYLPTVGTKVRAGELIDNNEFIGYARYAVGNRDWTLPGLNTYVTWTEKYGTLFDARALREQLSNPELLGVYVDLLENAVQYNINGDELTLAGHYMIGQREYYVTITAKYNGEKFMITDARPVPSGEYEAIREDILGYTKTMEDEHNVFENIEMPFRFKVVEWNGVPNPFNPYPVAVDSEDEVSEQN